MTIVKAEKAAKKPASKPVKAPKPFGPSSSSLAIAEALVKKFPQQATLIVTTMHTAAKSPSTVRKLARVLLALEFIAARKQEGAR